MSDSVDSVAIPSPEPQPEVVLPYAPIDNGPEITRSKPTKTEGLPPSTSTKKKRTAKVRALKGKTKIGSVNDVSYRDHDKYQKIKELHDPLCRDSEGKALPVATALMFQMWHVFHIELMSTIPGEGEFVEKEREKQVQRFLNVLSRLKKNDFFGENLVNDWKLTCNAIHQGVCHRVAPPTKASIAASLYEGLRDTLNPGSPSVSIPPQSIPANDEEEEITTSTNAFDISTECCLAYLQQQFEWDHCENMIDGVEEAMKDMSMWQKEFASQFLSEVEVEALRDLNLIRKLIKPKRLQILFNTTTFVHRLKRDLCRILYRLLSPNMEQVNYDDTPSLKQFKDYFLTAIPPAYMAFATSELTIEPEYTPISNETEEQFQARIKYMANKRLDQLLICAIKSGGKVVEWGTEYVNAAGGDSSLYDTEMVQQFLGLKLKSQFSIERQKYMNVMNQLIEQVEANPLKNCSINGKDQESNPEFPATQSTWIGLTNFLCRFMPATSAREFAFLVVQVMVRLEDVSKAILEVIDFNFDALAKEATPPSKKIPKSSDKQQSQQKRQAEEGLEDPEKTTKDSYKFFQPWVMSPWTFVLHGTNLHTWVTSLKSKHGRKSDREKTRVLLRDKLRLVKDHHKARRLGKDVEEISAKPLNSEEELCLTVSAKGARRACITLLQYLTPSVRMTIADILNYDRWVATLPPEEQQQEEGGGESSSENNNNQEASEFGINSIKPRLASISASPSPSKSSDDGTDEGSHQQHTNSPPKDEIDALFCGGESSLSKDEDDDDKIPLDINAPLNE